MTGSALIDFVITLVVLIGTGALFFVAIDRLAPDPMMNKIAKIAVGVVLLVVALLAVKAVLFGGGAGAISAGGIIGFAIGLIVILILLFIVEKLLDWLAPHIGTMITDIVKYVIFGIALIALLVVADRNLFAGRYVSSRLPDLGPTPQIMKPERR